MEKIVMCSVFFRRKWHAIFWNKNILVDLENEMRMLNKMFEDFMHSKTDDVGFNILFELGPLENSCINMHSTIVRIA